ncbi:hypothetical protein PABG_03718 [Paracoccidioides brasiliensis Pb03]|nr:hypothetical protein PABG_03718 [Paracoccidioides brasiliensis Pb03]
MNTHRPFEVPSSNDVLPSSHLRVHTMPTFPLSSPIREEIPTPFESPRSSQLAQSDQANPFESTEDNFCEGVFLNSSYAGNNVGRTDDLQNLLDEPSQAPRPSRWDSIKRPGRTIMKRNGKEGPAKKIRPGLNLVTNFANDTKYKRDAASKRRQSVARGFIDLQDLKLLPIGKETAKQTPERRLGTIRRRSSTKGYGQIKDGLGETVRGPNTSSHAQQSKKWPLDALRVSPSKTQDLSPSDRPIMIGLSVPYNDTIVSGKTKRTGNDNTPTKILASPTSQKSSNTTPVTPSIIVTPARDNNPWDPFSGNPEAYRTRPASSVYSQPTPRVKDSRPKSIIPPVPAIPTSHTSVKAMETSDIYVDQASTPARRHRAFSTGTVFEDDSPSNQRLSRPRSFSEESKQELPSRFSVDTIATRRRSQGWWNFLLSPLLSRSNTIASKMSLKSPQDETPPAIPPFPNALSAHVADKYVEVSFFSPDTPLSGEEKESIWASSAATAGKPNVGREAFDSEIDDDYDDDCSQSSPRQASNKTSHFSTFSTQTVPFMISSPSSAGFSQQHFYESVHDQFTTSRVSQFSPSANPYPRPFRNAESFSPMSNVRTQIQQNQNFNNPFFQRFADSVRYGEDSRERSNSDSTVIEDEPDFSPNVRQATVTPFVRAAAVGPFQTTSTIPARPLPTRDQKLLPAMVPSMSTQQKKSDSSPSLSLESSTTQPPPYSPPKRITQFRRYRAIPPPNLQPQPLSPGPLSPASQTQMASRGGILLSTMQQPQPPAAVFDPSNNHVRRGVLPPCLPNNPVHLSDVGRPTNVRAQNESRRQRLEREDEIGRMVGGLWRGRGCFSDRGCFGRPGREGRKKRRWYMGIATVLTIIIVVSIVLAVTLTRRHHDEAEPARWLNLTGYPPMPMGISTVAGPDAAVSNSGCIRPRSMWSCALPKENQEANKPFDSDQPNFRLQINFRNGSFLHSTVPSQSTTAKRSIFTFLATLNPLPGLLSRRSLQTRDTKFSPNPAPPSNREQTFLGNTTDGVTAPFAGEDTPFFATFLSPESKTATTRQRRADILGSSGDLNLTYVIPQPAQNSDGTSAPANLHPLPISQPIRLYDRGLPTEHYGFYSYYDRSIFLKYDIPLNSTITDVAPDDEHGGSTRAAARHRCTWTQTRFLVQFWTKPSQNNMNLTPTPSATSSPDSKTPFPTLTMNFTRPVSFPYPITIALDRHGGDPKSKMVYCYKLDVAQRYLMESKQLQIEQRNFGGSLINPGKLFNGMPSAGGIEKRTVDMDVGGFDGGNGGCRCEWRNWLRSR